MNINQLQEQVKEWYDEMGFDSSPQTLLLGATEELGELASITLSTMTDDFDVSERKINLLHGEGTSPEEEVGDIITYLLAYCNKVGIVPYFEWKNHERKT